MDGLKLPYLALFAILAAPVSADWVPDLRDDGQTFFGGVVSNPADVSMHCIGPSAGAEPSDAADPRHSPIYAVRVSISDRLVPSDAGTDPRSDVTLWLDGAGYQFSTIIWNAETRVWETDIALVDPVVGAMQRANAFVIGPVAGPQFQMDTAGLAPALSQAVTFCVSEYARLGHPVPTALLPFALSQPEDQSAATIADVAEQAVAQACSGGMRFEPGHILVGNIDGDLAPDAVVDWGKIQCSSGVPRPFCGAASCAADVYLSRSYGLTGRPESLLALGVSLVPLDNGNQGLQVGGSLSACKSAGKGNACNFIWYWTGSELDVLQ